MIESESGEKMRMEADRDYLRDVYEQMKERFDEEARRRQAAEEELQRAREEATRALLCNGSPGHGGSLCDELMFLKKVYTEEQVELQSQLQVANISVEVEVSRPDLSSALRDIRSQYERLAHKNMQAAEEWYKNKFASVARWPARTTRQCGQFERRPWSTAGCSSHARPRSKVRICHLESDITEAKQEMARYLKDYQDLLNVKMALDIEIAAYRKLLEGEEIRLALPAFN
ncbi:hypothetical protein WMY93_016730 [Mugilogobius chulae]|uniref:IF rod domain-containing protein n=1 Tax=Mugilogobius chulae TaxID=88201 RepID=A0AAW0NMC2_9GOBI